MSGHKYLQLSRRGSISDSTFNRRDSTDEDRNQSVESLSSINVTLNIEHRRNWEFCVAPGAWTRILTNVVGMCSHVLCASLHHF